VSIALSVSLWKRAESLSEDIFRNHRPIGKKFTENVVIILENIESLSQWVIRATFQQNWRGGCFGNYLWTFIAYCTVWTVETVLYCSYCTVPIFSYRYLKHKNPAVNFWELQNLILKLFQAFVKYFFKNYKLKENGGSFAWLPSNYRKKMFVTAANRQPPLVSNLGWLFELKQCCNYS